MVDGQATLIAAGNWIPAFTLVRPVFEHVVKSVWLRTSASDEWIGQLWTPKAPGVVAETAKQRSLKEMLSDIGQSPPSTQIAGKLQFLYDFTGKAMHSFVHGGIYSVVQALAGPNSQNHMNLLRNSNGMLLICTQALLVPYDGWRHDYRALQERFLSVLPPLDPPAAGPEES